ncbi:MAG TPA: ATP-binding protein [Noviherbaspirillum sp.]|uniref:ATP-binding protein n=1 Tax=Noviherbaspirillum sp. TaxID=1926288 RepID=UPI002B489DCF|nr:ATP-binding protein [Noviherbaspirillum sp.]HJV85208.1 ATP-binding protein [Noviherbaspirillum sp.]
MTSIRTRLSALLFLAAILTALVIGVVTYREALKQNEELFDYQLRQIALSLRDQGVAPGQAFGFDEDMPDVVVQIWTANGAMLYLSHPGNPLFTRAMLGYTDIRAGNRLWRVYSLATHDRIIQVAQPFDLRRGLAASAALRSLTPLLAFAPLMALLIWWLVGSSMRPLRRVVREVEQRDAHSLEQVAEFDLPDEIAPMVKALNSLLQRLQRAFASQHAFVADAAHELRSPLTAVQLQLQLLERAPDEAAKEAALAKLHEGVNRATHLIEQLLTAAQTDPNDRSAALKPVDLAELMRQALSDVFMFAQQRGIDIEQDGPDKVMVGADAAGLRILARNLLDNAVRYTPEGGKVRVGIIDEASRVVLTVEDSGPGIADEARKRVFDRFYRGDSTGQTGSGLGLSIVKNIADQHGASIDLGRSVLGGLSVAVNFPK